MDAYEGRTVRLGPLCPLCEAAMEPGYVLDRGDGDAGRQSEWIGGEPIRSRWGMGLKFKRARRFAITTLRCEACGFLASYATTPLNDVQ